MHTFYFSNKMITNIDGVCHTSSCMKAAYVPSSYLFHAWLCLGWVQKLRTNKECWNFEKEMEAWWTIKRRWYWYLFSMHHVLVSGIEGIRNPCWKGNDTWLKNAWVSVLHRLCLINHCNAFHCELLLLEKEPDYNTLWPIIFSEK